MNHTIDRIKDTKYGRCRMIKKGPARRGSEAPKPSTKVSEDPVDVKDKSITTRFNSSALRYSGSSGTVKSASAPVRTRAESHLLRNMDEDNTVFTGCPESVEKMRRDSDFLRNEKQKDTINLSDDEKEKNVDEDEGQIFGAQFSEEEEDEGLAKKTSKFSF